MSYRIRHDYDLPDGRSITVSLQHDGDDRYQRLAELERELLGRRHDLDINWHVIRTITVDMHNAVEEGFEADQRAQ